jgi:DnaJ domain
VIAYVLLGIALLVGGILAMRWFASADPKALAKAARVALAGVGVVVFLLMLVSGQLGLAAMLIAAVLPAVMRWRTLQRTRQGPSAGQESTVETRFLRMSLDHDTGVMSGTVLEGSHRGRQLHEMALGDLLELMRECRVADAQSASVLEAYLDRTQPSDWRQGEGGSADQAASHGSAPEPAGAMTRDEAYRVLGLEPGADIEAVKAAHRRLMRNVHPDHGGSTWIAAKINQAKDLLTKT